MKRNETHWKIIHEYFDGKGLQFKEYGYSKADIQDFAGVVMDYIKPDVARSIIMDILSRVYQYE